MVHHVAIHAPKQRGYLQGRDHDVLIDTTKGRQTGDEHPQVRLLRNHWGQAVIIFLFCLDAPRGGRDVVLPGGAVSPPGGGVRGCLRNY